MNGDFYCSLGTALTTTRITPRQNPVKGNNDPATGADSFQHVLYKQGANRTPMTRVRAHGAAAGFRLGFL